MQEEEKKMSGIRDVFEILPIKIRDVLQKESDVSSIQEIRIKINKNIIYLKNREEKICSYICTKEDLDYIIRKISNYSIYAFEEELKQGYITLNGGHRVGLCGVCVVENNKIKTIKDIGSINVRISKNIEGCAMKVLKHIIYGQSIYNTIVISPPKCGKTTLIRDMARNISDGIDEYNFKGKNTCIIDERSEIAACYRGIPQMKVGLRTDVLDNCPKSFGIMMSIRSMAPEVIICDEIGTYEDMKSIIMALNSGVSIVTTIHGNSIEDLFNRPVFKEVVDNKVFKRAIILNNKNKIGNVEYIYDFVKSQYIQV